MKTIHFRYQRGDKFFLHGNKSLECVVLEQGAYSISKGTFEYIVQILHTREIVNVREEELYHQAEIENNGYEVDE